MFKRLKTWLEKRVISQYRLDFEVDITRVKQYADLMAGVIAHEIDRNSAIDSITQEEIDDLSQQLNTVALLLIKEGVFKRLGEEIKDVASADTTDTEPKPITVSFNLPG